MKWKKLQNFSVEEWYFDFLVKFKLGIQVCC